LREHVESRPARHLFILLQGLTGTGKTLAVANLARALHGRVVRPIAGGRENSLPDADRLASVADRCDTYLNANYAQRSAILDAVRDADVVMEGYVFRTLAHHRAMGLETLPTVNWSLAVRPDVGVLLVCDEQARRERLMTRDDRLGTTPWHVQAERAAAAELASYRHYHWPEVDTSDLSPEQVTAEILTHVQRARATRQR